MGGVLYIHVGYIHGCKNRIAFIAIYLTIEIAFITT